MTEERPVLDVVTVDVRELAFGSGIPACIDAMIRSMSIGIQTGPPIGAQK